MNGSTPHRHGSHTPRRAGRTAPPRSHPPRLRGQNKHPGHGRQRQTCLQAIHELMRHLPGAQPDQRQQQRLRGRAAVDAGEAHEAQGIGQRRHPQRRPQRDQRRQGEHQQHDEG